MIDFECLTEGYYECEDRIGRIIIAFFDGQRKTFDTNEVRRVIRKLNW